MKALRWQSVSFGIMTMFLIPKTSEARNRPFFQASRALAMGDAYTAHTMGYEAVYYNPAGVAKRNKFQIKYADVEIAGSQTMYSLFYSSVSNIGNLSGILTNVASNPDKIYSLGLTILPQILVKNFSVGLLIRTYFDAYVDATTLDMNTFAYTDLATYMHYGLALFGGVLKVGVGAKVLDRAELERTYTPAEYASTSGLEFGSQWKEGLGVGFDVGLLLTAPIAGLPTLGIAVLDAGNTRITEQHIVFTGAAGIPGSPPSIQQKINVGLGVNFKHSPGVKSAINLETKDVVNIADGYRERLHAGWELTINESIFLRAGYNQGYYWTAGIGLNVAGVGLEFASYGENLLWGTGARMDDRKYVGRYVLAF